MNDAIAWSLCVLAQTPNGGNGKRVDIAIMVGLAAVGIGAWLLWRHKKRTAAEDEAFLAVQSIKGFAPVRGETQLAALAETAVDLFSDLRMFVREVTIAGALAAEIDGFEVTAVHLVLGPETDRSNANHQTLDKVIVLIDGLPDGLPAFSLTPNNFMLRHIHRSKVFLPTDRFGARNLVRGVEKDRITALFTDEAKELLRDNRETVVISRHDRLAFLLHGDRVQPADFEGFLRDALALATIFREQAAGGLQPLHHA